MFTLSTFHVSKVKITQARLNSIGGYISEGKLFLFLATNEKSVQNYLFDLKDRKLSNL